MKAAKILSASVALLLTAVFAGALYLATYLDEHRVLLEAGISKALGREVRIEGGVKVHWSMTPSVALEGLWVGNAEWASAPSLAHARRAIVTFGLVPLLSRRLELSEVRLLKADVYLEKAADGRYNWESSGTGKGDAGIAVAIRALQVEDSSLHYRASTGSDLVLNLPRLEFGNPGDGEIVLQGNLSYQDVPLSLSGTARNQAGVGSSARNFAIRAEIPDATLDISGDVRGIRDFSRLEMDLNSDRLDLRKWLSLLWPAVAFDGTLKTLKARLKTSGDTVESLTANTNGTLTAASAVLKPPTGKGAEDGGLALTGLRIDVEPGQAVGLKSALVYAEQSFQIRLNAGTFEDLFSSRETWRRIKVDAKGQLKGRAVEITGEVGPWSTQGAGAGLGVDLTLRDKDLKVGVKGSLARFDALQGNRFAVTASAPSLAGLNPWLGVTMPSSAPFAFSANVEGGERQFSLRDLKLTSGDSDIGGKLTVPLVKGGRFEAILESRVLDLRPYVAAFSQQNGGAVPLLHRESPSDALHGLDGSLRYRVRNLKTGAMELKTVSLDATLDKGHLKFTLAADDENLNADVKLQPAGAHWHLALEHKGKLVFGNIIAFDQAVSDRPRPPVETELTLNATGRSLGAMLASANGKLVMVLGPGELNEQLTSNLLLGDVLLALLSTISPGDQAKHGIRMECAVIQMDIAKGIATSSKGLALRTENFNVLGGGAWKLRTGEIDLQFKTAHRKGLGISVVGIADRLVRLTGQIHKPEVTLNVEGAAVYGAAAWATGGLSILYDSVFKRLTTTGNPCDTVLEAIDK